MEMKLSLQSLELIAASLQSTLGDDSTTLMREEFELVLKQVELFIKIEILQELRNEARTLAIVDELKAKPRLSIA